MFLATKSLFSMEPAEMAQLVIESERAWQALGQVHYGSTAAEKKSLVFRRSLYVAKDMKAGDILTTENVRAIRPGLGLPPKYLDSLPGVAVRKDIKAGTSLTFELLK